MSVNMMGTTIRKPRLSASFRLDGNHATSDMTEPQDWSWSMPWRLAAIVVMSTLFVFLYAAGLDLGPEEARLGLAAEETLAPFGQVFGGWEPTLLPGQLVPSLLWAWGEGGMPTSNSIRWPAAIAGALVGLFLTRGAATALNGRAGVLAGLCWYGSFAMIDHSSATGLDFLTGLATVGALARLLGPGADWTAGFFGALACLCGGWPPLAVIALVTVVLGRPQSTLSGRMATPPLVAMVAWTAWALKGAPPEVWGASIFKPLTESPAWLMLPGVVALGLPWSPLAMLAAWRSVREGWSPAGRSLVFGWLQIAGAAALAGSIVPGLATASRLPALAGLAVVAGASIDRVLTSWDTLPRSARRWFLGSIVAMVLAWTGMVVPLGGYLAAAVAYYRFLSVMLIALAIPMAMITLFAAYQSRPMLSLSCLIVLALFIKIGHAGYYIPEWNYRFSQGPWGRAIGQWVPPRWPVYTTHAWRADLAFAMGRPVRQLVSPRHLQYQPGEARYVLLLASEFENWPDQAPQLLKVASFQDEYDQTRVLARTAGPLPWSRLAGDDEEE